MKPIKFTVKDIPETLADMPKKAEREPFIHINMRLRQATIKKLREKSIETGYPQQEIIDMALVAFLK